MLSTVSIRSIIIASLIVATVAQDLPSESVRSGVHDKRYGARGLHGDVHLTGFQGQPFSVQTESGSIYALLSMPDMYVNARMVDMTTADHCVGEVATHAMPERSAGECLSYPGTYMTDIGIVSGTDRITIAAAPRGDALVVVVNGEAFDWSHLTVALGNSSSIELNAHRSTLTFINGDVRITVRNVDRYVSVVVEVLRSEWLSAGKRAAIPRNVNSRYANDEAGSQLPVVMHGLLGQTISYIIYKGGRVIQGDASNYVVSSLLSPQFPFSQYQAISAPKASISYNN